jgi:hypothetical protein
MKKLILICLVLCILSTAVYAVVDEKTGLEQRGDCPDMYEAAYKITQEQNCKLSWIDSTSTKMFCKNDEGWFANEGWFAIDIVCSGVVLKMGYMTKADLITEGYILAGKSSTNVIIGIIAFLAAAFILIKSISHFINKRKQTDRAISEYIANRKESEEDLLEEEDEEDESSTPKKKGAIRVIPKKRHHDPISDQADKKDAIDNGGIKGW